MHCIVLHLFYLGDDEENKKKLAATNALFCCFLVPNDLVFLYYPVLQQTTYNEKSQIQAAADQMDMMANNPQMMAMAKEQMSKMTPEQIADLQQNGGGGAGMGMPTMPAQNDPQQAAKTIGEMTPEQLRYQATMLRSTDPATIRRMNPQMAQMTDAQISAAAAQFDMMASNPAMAKMAMEQMKGMTPAQMQAAQQGGMDGAGGMGGMDPTEMFKNMDKTQLKQMLAMVQQNPDSIQQLAASTGISEAQIKQGVDMFANMDDTKMDMALKGYVPIVILIFVRTWYCFCFIVSPFSFSLTHYTTYTDPSSLFFFSWFFYISEQTASNRYKKWIKYGRRWITKLVETWNGFLSWCLWSSWDYWLITSRTGTVAVVAAAVVVRPLYHQRY